MSHKLESFAMMTKKTGVAKSVVDTHTAFVSSRRFLFSRKSENNTRHSLRHQDIDSSEDTR